MKKKKNKRVYIVVEVMMFSDGDFWGVYPNTFDNYDAAKEFFEDRKVQITRFMLEYTTGFKDNYEIFQEKYYEEEKYIIRERENYLNSVGLVLRTDNLHNENLFAGRTEE